ncbi:ABC transporter permease [Planosporangium mesophilum]|uniref:ABC transporter permease n=1 Tax=Planosporangium mesophilum TaxID=689768 RepID=A0A8J3TEL0_9ACTN|nr:ABC transporter permease [Planosporangium mesophilum]NJC82788.1 ABC transporter permease [Planosporangium mesophilum]GII23742.1 ABC transporter permease [Planosporangium mesophilum]
MTAVTTAASTRRIAWTRRRRSLARFCREYAKSRAGMFGLCVLVLAGGAAVAAPLFISAHELSAVYAPGSPLRPPSARFPLGTDGYGRSMVAVTVWGARISLTVGFLATFMSIGIGTLVGITAAHFRGWADTVLMRVTDWFLVLPTLVLAAALASVLPRGVTTVVVAIGVTCWATTARLVRSQTLTVESRPYIERATALGAGHWHVMTRHVLPNVMPLVLAQTTLIVSEAILLEATLAFLGLSDPTKVSWGTTLQLARQVGAVSAGDWWVLLPPGLAIAAVALAFSLCGRTMESVLNPRLRERA